MTSDSNPIGRFGRVLVPPVVILGLLALAVSASLGTDGTNGATSPTPRSTSVTTAPLAPATSISSITSPREPFVYRVGLSEPPTTNNFWAYYDPQSSLVDQYILDPTKPALYTYDLPGFDLAADVARDDGAPQPVEDGDSWTVTVPLKADAMWSDGEPITADDVVFTFETVRELALPRGWVGAYPLGSSTSLGLVAIEAVDTRTVLLRYNGRPGLPFWPNGPGTAPIMPKHFWEPIVADALAADDPLIALLTADATGEPSGGPIVITEFGRDRIQAVPNEHYQRTGTEVNSGGATYEVGPFFEQMVFEVYAGPAAAAEALDAGDIDVILSPAGIGREEAAFLASNPSVESISNATNGFRYVAFNLRNPPMSSPAFRDALALVIDKEFVANEMLGGQIAPLYSTVPSANLRWYDAEKADAFANRYRDVSTEVRLSGAVTLLEDAGFTWEQRPAFIDNAVLAGSGVLLDGEPVPPIRILAPGPTFDPVRSTYALWIQEWLTQLGFATEITLTDFSTVVTRAFTPTPAGTLDFDAYVLGWRLPSPAMPVYHESFWASKNDTLVNNGNNNSGFADETFDALVDSYNRSETMDEATEILWRMEQVIFDEKPYVVLYDAPIVEAFRADTVLYPFTANLSGIQFINGMPALVRPQP